MKGLLSALMLVLLLLCPALAWERLGHEPEKFRGNVKTVRTTTTRLVKESGTWVNQGEPFERVEEISDRLKSGNDKDPDRAENSASINSPEQDPLKTRKADGYDAGYNVSNGAHGFFKTDKKDNIVEAVHYSSNGDLAGKDFYTYDLNGHEIEKASFSADGTFTSKRITIYDSDGNKIDQTDYLSDRTVGRKLNWTYDFNNSVTEESFFEAGVLKYKLTYVYKYDRQGNWVSRVKVSEGFDLDHPTRDIMEIAERVLTYR